MRLSPSSTIILIIAAFVAFLLLPLLGAMVDGVTL